MKESKIMKVTINQAIHNEKGVVLIGAIALVAVLALLGTVSVITTSTELMISQNHKTSVKASYAAQAGTEEADGIQDSILVLLESIVVNLEGIDSNTYLRIQISLGVDSEDAQKMISEKMVIIRDKIISFFSAKTVKDIDTEGLFKLRLEIKDLLNKFLGSGDIIKQVYFSDFIVQ